MDRRGEKHRFPGRSLGVLIVGVLLGLGLRPNPVPGSSEERALIVGVPRDEITLWAKHLAEIELDFRYDRTARSFFIDRDPIPVLEAARSRKGLERTAERGLLERRIEADIRKRWPRVEEPRVCLAFPSEEIGPVEDGEPVALIYAKGLTREGLVEARELAAERVKALPARNVIVIGAEWPMKSRAGSREKKSWLADSRFGRK